MNHLTHRAEQLKKVANGDPEMLEVSFRDKNDQTRWLVISPVEFDGICQILLSNQVDQEKKGSV